MRIISGKYRGKKLKGYDIDGTRPTMDRVKESLFGMIQLYIPDSSVLDLFAGSGALGIEAISEGASSLVMVENNEIAIKALKENISGFDDDIEIIKMDYKKFLKTTSLSFDVIFLDPPYRAGLLNKALRIIEERKIINPGGIVVCEYENVKIETNLIKIKEKKYGEKIISIFKS